MSDVFPLPPKMLQIYVEKAKRGEATRTLGDGPGTIYIFEGRTEKITVIGADDHAIGHYRKVKAATP